MTSSKKLLISAAVLAGGYALALLCGSPFLPALPGSSGSSGEQTDEGFVVIGSASLVPEAGPTAPALLSLPEVDTSSATGNAVQPLAAAAPPKARLTTVSSGPPKPASVATPPGSVIAAAATDAQQRASLPVQASFDAPAHFDTGPPSLVGLERVAPTDLVGQRTHIVIDGDSLTKLAERYLDDPHRGSDIFELNRGALTDPNLLPIGAELKIPARAPVREPSANTISTQDDPTLGVVERGLVPVGQMPAQTSVAPRAQLMQPIPAGWPAND